MRLIQIFLFYSVLLWLAVMLLLAQIGAILLLLILPKKIGVLIGQMFSTIIFGAFLWVCKTLGLMRLDLTALDTLNSDSGLIIAPNHPSMTDVFLILSRVKNVTCFMKSSIWRNILLSAGARLAGFIKNDNSYQVIRDATILLKSGGKLLIFPEGTRTVNYPINPLKEGIGLIAKRSNAPIQTFFLLTNSPYLSKHWHILKPPMFPVKYKAVLGKRLTYGEYSKNIVNALEKQYVKYLSQH